MHTSGKAQPSDSKKPHLNSLDPKLHTLISVSTFNMPAFS